MPGSRRFRVRKLVVRPDRIVAHVVCDAAHRYTDPALAKRVQALRPNLPRHACINGSGPTFSSVMDCTPVPHLFEHLVIDLITERCGRHGDVFVGTSEWEDEANGCARVEVSFSDDLDALGAIKDAAEMIDALLD